MQCSSVEGELEEEELEEVLEEELELEESEYAFTIESTGVMPPQDIVVSALATLRSKLHELQGSCSEIDQANS